MDYINEMKVTLAETKEITRQTIERLDHIIAIIDRHDAQDPAVSEDPDNGISGT